MNVLSASAPARIQTARTGMPGATPSEASPDQVSLQEPKDNQHSLVYKAGRAVIGSVGAIAMGTLGAAVGGVTNSGDTVIPAKVQHVAGKILRPALAMVGAAVGILVGLSALPLGPVAGALAGTVAGAVIGGAFPGAVDAFAASTAGAMKGLVQGVKSGWHGATTAMDKVTEKLHHDEPAPAPAPQPTPAPVKAAADPVQLELPFIAIKS